MPLRSKRRKRIKIRDAIKEHRDAGGIFSFISKGRSEEQDSKKSRKISIMNVNIKRKRGEDDDTV